MLILTGISSSAYSALISQTVLNGPFKNHLPLTLSATRSAREHLTNAWQGPRPCTVRFNMNRALLLSIAVTQHWCSVTLVGLFKGSLQQLLSNSAEGKVSYIQRSKDLSDLLCLPSHLLSTVNWRDNSYNAFTRTPYHTCNQGTIKTECTRPPGRLVQWLCDA